MDSPAETLNKALEDLTLLALNALEESGPASSITGPSVLSLNALGNALPQLGKQDVQQLLQALLHLPPDMDQCLEKWIKPPLEGDLQAAVEETEQQNKPEALLQLTGIEALPELDLEAVQKALKQQVGLGQERLSKLLQGGNLVNLATHAPAVGDLMTQLQTMGNQLLAPPQQSLTPLVLLYLPYLPIGVLPLPPPWPDWPDNGDSTEEEVAESGNLPNLLIYLETVTLGKFKAVLQLESRVQLHILLTHEPPAKPHLIVWEEQFKTVMGENGLPAPRLTFTALPETHTEVSSGSSSVLLSGKVPALPMRKLAMLPPLNLPLLLLHAAYKLARIIFETDQRQNILKRRRQKT